MKKPIHTLAAAIFAAIVLPDYVVLISTLGGIEVFGLNGFVIGPLIAAMFMVSWEIFSTSRRVSGDDATGDANP